MRLNTLLATFFLAAGFLAPGQLAAAIFNINTGQAAVDPVWTMGSVSEVPEPSTFAGMGIGLMALGWWKRRQTR